MADTEATAPLLGSDEPSSAAPAVAPEAPTVSPEVVAETPEQTGEGPEDVSTAWEMKKVFPSILTAILLLLITAFAVFTKYDETADTEEYYLYYIHVAVMIFVGFGFLMTFLRRYSLGAVSLNMVTSCMMMLAAVLLHGMFEAEFDFKLNFISISINTLIQGLFCAGAGMITFGALLGKCSPTQLVIILLIEVPIYAFNAEYLVGNVWGSRGAQDLGGSIAIHLFGAYFGLAASMVLFNKSSGIGGTHPKNGSAYITDVTAMIGTIFLWIYWPSFNAAIATVSAGDTTPASLRMYAIINTSLSLCAATIMTFAASSFFKGEVDMVLVQNATLAGGVAVGSAATMVVDSATVINITPGGAVLVGAIAGLLSSWGFTYLSSYLEDKFGLKDTCGVHNLHGMPGLMGGLVPIVVLASCCQKGAAYAQGLAVLTTLVVAVVGGVVAGFLVSFIDNEKGAALEKKVYEDAPVFGVDEED